MLRKKTLYESVKNILNKFIKPKQLKLPIVFSQTSPAGQGHSLKSHQEHSLISVHSCHPEPEKQNKKNFENLALKTRLKQFLSNQRIQVYPHKERSHL